MTGGIAAPLLAGFSLTTVAQLVIGPDHPWLSQWAIALFAVSASLFLYVVQFSALALGYAATPAERLDFNPEASASPDILRVVRERQWEEMELRASYTTRAGWCYNVAILAFLAGLGLLLVPHSRWPWAAGRLIGLAVIGGAFAIELMWTISKATWPKALLPTSSSVAPDPVPGDGAEYLFASSSAEERNDLRRCVELLQQIVRATTSCDDKRPEATEQASPGGPVAP